jgi:hypothetical protein
LISEELYKAIDYATATRANRQKASQWILDHPENFPELLEVIYSGKGDISYKAAWVLEFICRKQLVCLYPHLTYFFENLPCASKDQIVRPMAYLCELLAIAYYKKKDPQLLCLLTETHKTHMTECSFDWLISDQKVACQVHAMTALYFLGTEYDWIHPELEQMVQQNIHSGSAGYKARGRLILSKITKYNPDNNREKNSKGN